jgi:hypothetical protein
MPRNFNCNCLCHGQDGNVTDPYFACKNCYSANHMGNLPRQSWEDAPRPKLPKKERKPRAPKTPTGTIEAVAAAAIKGDFKPAAAKIMYDIAEAAQDIKDGKPVRS